MLSYISNSNKLDATRAIVLLLSGLFLYFCALEAVTSIGLKRVSQGAKRIHEDYSRALTLRPLGPDETKTVLVAGNSLLLAGVDRKRLIAEMSPEYSVTLLPIENTTYLDWYFGLRRIFAEGARPSVFVLCLSLRHLTSNSVNGESFAHHMMRLSDILLVTKAADLDMTATSSFFFSNLSSWLGNRALIRNWILETWLPNASLLTSSLIPRTQPTMESKQREIATAAEHRLREVRDLSAIYGARFLFLVPPLTSTPLKSKESLSLAEQIRQSANGRGITVLIPYLPGELATEYFSDGLHLNPQGARVFTERLGPMLQSGLKTSAPNVSK